MKKILNNISLVISTVFGIGYFPKVPGTFASLIVALFYFLVPVNLSKIENPGIFAVLILVFSIISIYLMTLAESILGNDNQHIVLDEVWGYFVTILLLPKIIPVIAFGFILFRIYDILKPFPINKLQNMKGGFGIISDDLLAGVYANISLRILLKTVF